MKRMTRCGRGNNKGFLPTAAAGTAELVYEGMLRICMYGNEFRFSCDFFVWFRFPAKK